MGSLLFMENTIEGSERLLDAIKVDLHEGAFASAQEKATLLVRVLDGSKVPCCLECGMALTADEIDRYTSWCGDDAPVLALRFE